MAPQANTVRSPSRSNSDLRNAPPAALTALSSPPLPPGSPLIPLAARNGSDTQAQTVPSSHASQATTRSNSQTVPDIDLGSRVIEPLKLSVSYYARERVLKREQDIAQKAIKAKAKQLPVPPPAPPLPPEQLALLLKSSAPPIPTSSYVTAFFFDILLRQIYWHLLLRIPEFYWSRVSRLVEMADIPDQELAWILSGLKGNHVAAASSYTLALPNAKWLSGSYAQLENSWDNFLNSAIREWKIMNIVSVLLLGAIASLLQVQVVATDPLIRTAAFISMVCALMSLLYGCIYSIRFFDLRKSYKAFPWTEEAKRNQLNPLWNIWVFLAMPAVWLVWSLIAYLICLMGYVWRVGDDGLSTSTPTRNGLSLRIAVTLVLGLGFIYLSLIISTLKTYGRTMENQWQERASELQKLIPQGFIPKSSQIALQTIPELNLPPGHPYSDLRNLAQQALNSSQGGSPNSIASSLPPRDTRSRSATPELPLHSALKKPRSLSPLNPLVHPHSPTLHPDDPSFPVPSSNRQAPKAPSIHVAFSSFSSIIRSPQRRAESLPLPLGTVFEDEPRARKAAQRSKSVDSALEEVTPNLLKEGDLSPISGSPYSTPISLQSFVQSESSEQSCPLPTAKSVPKWDSSVFPTVKVLSLNPVKMVEPPFVCDERDIKLKDWDNLLQDLNHILPSDSQIFDGEDSVAGFQLSTFLNSWNDRFSRKGVKLVCCCELPMNTSKVQYSLYLCDIARPAERMLLGVGEFESDVLESVRIMVFSTGTSLRNI